MSYANRLFSHCRVSWVITSCCSRPFHEKWKIESPAFIVDGEVQSKWRMILKHTSESSADSEGVEFELIRLRHGQGQNLWVCFKLFLYKGSEFTELIDIHTATDLGYSWTSKPIDNLELQKDSVKLQFQILVWMKTDEPIALCNDIFLRQLSADLNTICNADHAGSGFDRRFQTRNVDNVRGHESILCQRIKNAALCDVVHNNEYITNFSGIPYDSVDKIVNFLYTANMVPVITYPQLETFDLAEQFNVQPIVSYYQPDFLNMHTATQLKSFNLTWSIKDLCSRGEVFLTSPTISGNFYESILVILPNMNRGHVKLRGDIKLSRPMKLCVKLFLVTENCKHTVLNFYGDFDDENPCKYLGTIQPELLLLVPKDKPVTLQLEVSMTTCEEESSMGISKIIRKPYCDQQNYIDLSKDMLSLYERTDFKNSAIPLPNRVTALRDTYGFILNARNSDFVNALLEDSNNNINRIKFETLDQVVQFLFSGKFSEKLDYHDVFYLYGMAVNTEFDILRKALENSLKDNIFRDIIRVYEFASTRNITDLQDFISDRVNVNKIYEDE